MYTMQITTSAVSNKLSTRLAPAESANTGLYDLWLNSMLPTVSPSMVTGVTSSSSHQIAGQIVNLRIDSERLAEKLMQLGCDQMPTGMAKERL